MTDHTRALVPIETWAFSSPALRSRDVSIDIGQFAESLLYYEQVLVNVANQQQFAQFLAWFVNQNRLSTLLSLVAEGTIQFYEYSFMTAAVHLEEIGHYDLMNIQDEKQRLPNSFEDRFLYHKEVEAIIPKGRYRSKLYQAFRGKVIEAKADEFVQAIEEARHDATDARRNALIVQSFVDEFYEYKRLGRPPQVDCTIITNGDGSHTTTLNINVENLSKLAGPLINWNKLTPATGNAINCRFLQSASNLNCDLYLGSPMSRLVGDKLFESARACNRPGEIIQTLKDGVEFPDIRWLVNEGKLGIDEVLYFRTKAKRFRRWIQDEANRDRDALIAYHHEVAKESGITHTGKRMLNLFGFVGGSAVGAYLGADAGPTGSALGAATGGVVSWLADLGSKVGGQWRPVVFGNWYRDRIVEFDKSRSK